MMFGGSLFLLLIIGIVIAAIWFGSDNQSFQDRFGSGTGRNTPLEILRKRYAQGEISREEFERMKRDLSGHSQA